MFSRKVTCQESRWIAADARYVFKDRDQRLHQDALTYSLVHRRMLDRVDDDMMRAIVDYDGGRLEVLAQGWGELASVVRRMDWFTWLVLNTEGNAFDFERREDGKLIRVEEHELGQYYPYIRPLIFAVFDDELNLARFRLPPYAQLFRDVVADHINAIPVIFQCFANFPTYFDTYLLRFCGELANDLFAAIRREATVRQVDRIVAERKASGVRKLGRMHEFKKKCYLRCPLLNVMQLECAYRPPERQNSRVTVPLDHAKRDHARFVNRLRGNAKFAAVAIGGIWSLAWGEHKGHHFRWTFMLDATLVEDPTEWKEFVASVWESVVRDGFSRVVRNFPLPAGGGNTIDIATLTSCADDRRDGLKDFLGVLLNGVGVDCDPHEGLVSTYASPVSGLICANDTARMKMLDDELKYFAFKDSLIRPHEVEDARSWGTWVSAYTHEDRCCGTRERDNAASPMKPRE